MTARHRRVRGPGVRTQSSKFRQPEPLCQKSIQNSYKHSITCFWYLLVVSFCILFWFVLSDTIFVALQTFIIRQAFFMDAIAKIFTGLRIPIIGTLKITIRYAVSRHDVINIYKQCYDEYYHQKTGSKEFEWKRIAHLFFHRSFWLYKNIFQRRVVPTQ